MPQLDFSIFPSQFFWLTISFFCLLFIMSKFIIPKTAEMIELRRKKIDGELEQASQLKEQVAEGIKKYEEALKDAQNKARITLQKTRDELGETVNRKQSDLVTRLNVEIEQGEQKIIAAKQKAMQKIDDSIVDLALGVLNKIGIENIESKSVQQVADVVKGNING